MNDDDLDLDYDTIDEIDDADDDSLHVLIKDRVTGDYGWHWVYRDNLAEHGLNDLAQYGALTRVECHRRVGAAKPNGRTSGPRWAMWWRVTGGCHFFSRASATSLRSCVPLWSTTPSRFE